MSFIITVHTHEGLVMAADSRITLTGAVGSYEFSNASPKLFCTKRGVGIAACGDAGIGGAPIAGFINDFVLANGDLEPEPLANKLLTEFKAKTPIPNSVFHVCGYDNSHTQRVLVVGVREGLVVDQNTAKAQGAFWGGEQDIVMRLVQPIATINPDGTVKSKLPSYSIPFNFFSLQDAIDFAMFAMNATIGAIRFMERHKTVGGPVDLLVIKPDASQWVHRKELHS